MSTQPSPYSDSFTGAVARKTKSNRCNQHSSPVAARPLKYPLYDLSTLKPEDWEKSRLCWYCDLPFTPRAKSAWKSHFCCDGHRMAFNKYGRLPFDKLMLALREEIRQQIEKQTFDEVLKKAEKIIERRATEREAELTAKLRSVVAAMVLDPAKAVRELESFAAGGERPKKL